MKPKVEWNVCKELQSTKPKRIPKSKRRKPEPGIIEQNGSIVKPVKAKLQLNSGQTLAKRTYVAPQPVAANPLVPLSKWKLMPQHVKNLDHTRLAPGLYVAQCFFANESTSHAFKNFPYPYHKAWTGINSSTHDPGFSRGTILTFIKYIDVEEIDASAVDFSYHQNEPPKIIQCKRAVFLYAGRLIIIGDTQYVTVIGSTNDKSRIEVAC